VDRNGLSELIVFVSGCFSPAVFECCYGVVSFSRLCCRNFCFRCSMKRWFLVYLLLGGEDCCEWLACVCWWLFECDCFVMAVMGVTFNSRNFVDVALLCWGCSIVCWFLFGFLLGK